MCLESLFGGGGGTDDSVIPVTPSPVHVRNTPIINQTTGANVRFGADAAAKAERISGKKSKIAGQIDKTKSNVGIFI